MNDAHSSQPHSSEPQRSGPDSPGDSGPSPDSGGSAQASPSHPETSPAASGPDDSLTAVMDREVRKIQDIARARFGDLTPEQLTWSPEPDRWGIAECLEHLLKTNHLYLKQMEPAVESLEPSPDPARVKTDGGTFGRWFTRLVGPGSGMKLPAPGGFRPGKGGSSTSAEVRTVENVVPRFLAQQDRILELLRKADGRSLDDARIHSPATRLIRFRLSDAVRAMIAHVWRHLGQAERVLDHPDFPHETHDTGDGDASTPSASSPA